MELAQERKIEIEDGGEKLAHYFKELRSKEWLDWQQKDATREDPAEQPRPPKMGPLRRD